MEAKKTTKTLYPISTLPKNATADTVELYQAAQGYYKGPLAFGVQKVIPCKDFRMTIQDATCWCPKTS